MIFFSFMIVTPLLPLYLSEEFEADKDTIGLVLSGYTLAALLVRPFSGYLVDSFPRKIVLLTSYFLFFAMFAGYLVAGTLALFALVRTLHGGPMGAVTVANSTCAIDVLPPSRRAEGIGYYGLSNNVATSIAPTVGLLLYDYFTGGYHLIFTVALAVAGVGLFINSLVHFTQKDVVSNQAPLSFDRFFLVKGWRESIVVVCFASSYGVLSTYLAIYGKEELEMTAGSGLWFFILSVGLILSRLVGARTLREGKIAENASRGIFLSLFGYLMFAAIHNAIGFMERPLSLAWATAIYGPQCKRCSSTSPTIISAVPPTARCLPRGMQVWDLASSAVAVSLNMLVILLRFGQRGLSILQPFSSSSE